MKVKSKTMNDGTKAKVIIREADDQYKTFTQDIIKVFPNEVTVMSRKENIYNVQLSDRVRMTMNVEVGDTAVIMPLNNGWLVTDIIKDEKMPTDEDAVVSLLEKLQRRKNRFILEGRSEEEIADLEEAIRVEEESETQRQIKEFEELLGGY